VFATAIYYFNPIWAKNESSAQVNYNLITSLPLTKVLQNFIFSLEKIQC